MQAEWIFLGGPVLSGHVDWRPAEAVAVAEGRVIAFGSRAEVMPTQGPATRVVDLGGRALLPGLTDAHLHMLGYAMTLDKLAVAGMASIEAVRRAVADQVAVRAEGDWVAGRGWDQDRWAERREPTRHDLDTVSPNHPVFLQRNCNHVAVVNTAALRMAGITADTPDPEGREVDRGPAAAQRAPAGGDPGPAEIVILPCRVEDLFEGQTPRRRPWRSCDRHRRP